jgi:hypothetical protein
MNGANYRENEIELLFAHNSLAASARLYREMLMDTSDPQALMGATDLFVRHGEGRGRCDQPDAIGSRFRRSRPMAEPSRGLLSNVRRRFGPGLDDEPSLAREQSRAARAPPGWYRSDSADQWWIVWRRLWFERVVPHGSTQRRQY